jgi:hypothetical protein
MWRFALIPFCLQAIAIAIDEGYFHYRRGLPKWERIGHPIDTLSLLICLGLVVFVPFSIDALKVYGALAVLSCILVTKDEFVHTEHCPGAENWLHALLFTLHPITLIMTGLMWPIVSSAEVPEWLAGWLTEPQPLATFLEMQFYAISVFLLYQIIAWNIFWKDKPVLVHKDQK